jgi:hypothetical protein
MRTPVQFISPGADGDIADMALHLPRPPALGYLNSSVRIRGEISLHRIATDSVEVSITRNGEPFTRVSAAFSPETGRSGFAFNVPCDAEGSFRYELTIPTVKGELTEKTTGPDFSQGGARTT